MAARTGATSLCGELIASTLYRAARAAKLKFVAIEVGP